MRREISNAEGRSVFGTVYVCQHRRNQCRTPLRSHHQVQIAVLVPVLHPLLELAEAEAFFCLSDSAATYPVKD